MQHKSYPFFPEHRSKLHREPKKYNTMRKAHAKLKQTNAIKTGKFSEKRHRGISPR